MSENQYEPKFITRREDASAIIRPFGPPSRSPMTSSSPLSAPSSSAVFSPFAMALFYLLSVSSAELPSSPASSAARHGRSAKLDVLVQGVGAVAAGPRPSKSWNPDRGREIPVRPAAGATFLQVLTELGGHVAGHLIETRHARPSLERRPVDAAADLEPRPRQSRPQPARAPARRRRIRHRRHPHVDAGARASPATTFVREPPEITPTFSVTPRLEILERARRATI